MPHPRSVIKIPNVGWSAAVRHQRDNLALIASYLAGEAVELVVVGGCARWLHGHDHAPADLDIVPEPSAANLRRLFDAFDALGRIDARYRPPAHVLATRSIVTRVTPIGSVDVLLRAGRADYASLATSAETMIVNGAPILVEPRV